MKRLSIAAGIALATALVSPATADVGKVPVSAASPIGRASEIPIRRIPIVVTADTLAGLPRRTLTVAEEHGGSAKYSGVDLGAVLARAGAPSGHAIRGGALASYVVVRGADGYRAVFALPELDPAFSDREVLLADQRDGAPLSQQLGPFRIVVPGEKRAARWVRNVTEIDFEPVP